MTRGSAASGGLNDNHLRHIHATFQHIDRLLSSIESVLDAPSTGSLFRRYEQSLSPGTRAAVLEGIGRIRETMAGALRGQGRSMPDSSPFLAAHIRSVLGFIDLDVEEIRPKHMGGYGRLGAEDAAELEAIVSEFRRQLKSLAQALESDPGAAGAGR